MPRNTAYSLDRSNVPWTDPTVGGPRGTVLFVGLSTTTASASFDVSGWKSLYVELVEMGGGTATLTLQGSLEAGSRWYTIGVQHLDGQATLTRAISVSVTASMSQYWQVLDLYPLIRGVLGSPAGGVALTAYLYALPV